MGNIAKIILVMANSKELFSDLVNQITTEQEQSEKESIIYLLLENKAALSRTAILAGKPIEHPLDYAPYIKRINQHEPIQCILQEAWFYGRQFYVNQAVLIPRPETELLVHEIKKHLEQTKKNTVQLLDLGTGSGCLAITLALGFPKATVAATDVSEQALRVAEKNATTLGARVAFTKHDMLADRFPQADLIVSNPPYIAPSEKGKMQMNVLEYEPAQALFVPEDDPLLFYKAIAKKSKAVLAANGSVWVEINERFGKENFALFEAEGFKHITIHKDIDGKDRFIGAFL